MCELFIIAQKIHQRLKKKKKTWNPYVLCTWKRIEGQSDQYTRVLWVKLKDIFIFNLFVFFALCLERSTEVLYSKIFIPNWLLHIYHSPSSGHTTASIIMTFVGTHILHTYKKVYIKNTFLKKVLKTLFYHTFVHCFTIVFIYIQSCVTFIYCVESKYY